MFGVEILAVLDISDLCMPCKWYSTSPVLNSNNAPKLSMYM